MIKVERPMLMGTFEMHHNSSLTLENGTRMAIGPDGTLHVARSNEMPIGVAYNVGSYCAHCKKLEDDHGPQGKCLFESTTFKRSDRVQVEMSGMTRVALCGKFATTVPGEIK